MKTCPNCKIEKPESDFYTSKSKSGLSSYCKACAGIKQKEWWINNKSRKADINRAWRNKNKPRRTLMQKAGNAMWKAIREGKLVRGSICQTCTSEDHIEAAHVDYSKPLEVLWLCTKCHRTWDAKLPKSFSKTDLSNNPVT